MMISTQWLTNLKYIGCYMGMGKCLFPDIHISWFSKQYSLIQQTYYISGVYRSRVHGRQSGVDNGWIDEQQSWTVNVFMSVMFANSLGVEWDWFSNMQNSD